MSYKSKYKESIISEFFKLSNDPNEPLLLSKQELWEFADGLRRKYDFQIKHLQEQINQLKLNPPTKIVRQSPMSKEGWQKI